MSKEELIQINGEIIEVLPNQTYKVFSEEYEYEVIAYTGGKMRQNKIRIVTGDKVIVEVSPYDLNKGRLVQRL